MKPPAFDYLRPESVTEALTTLAAEGEEARILAGGQSLTPMLNFRLAAPRLLIDISGMPELDRIEEEDAALVVSAAVTQARLLAWPGLGEASPLLAQALPWVGHYQTRNRGTVCGSIAHADPSAELPLCLFALHGSVRLRSAQAEREVAAEAFFTGALTTARRSDEMIVAVRFPKAAPGSGQAFRETAMRHGDFALAAVAAIAEGERLRLVVGGIGDRPVARDWPRLAGPALAAALADFADDLVASDDHHATTAYRRHLVREIGRQAIEEAIACRG